MEYWLSSKGTCAHTLVLCTRGRKFNFNLVKIQVSTLRDIKAQLCGQLAQVWPVNGERTVEEGASLKLENFSKLKLKEQGATLSIGASFDLQSRRKVDLNSQGANSLYTYMYNVYWRNFGQMG